jgi:hypothetical protein
MESWWAPGLVWTLFKEEKLFAPIKPQFLGITFMDKLLY